MKEKTMVQMRVNPVAKMMIAKRKNVVRRKTIKAATATDTVKTIEI